MWLGDVIAGRFVVERPVGSGGMGTVFFATDRSTGEPVAIKVIDAPEETSIERFRREARVLEDLSHPGIVRHVAHGETESGEPYLAMEWLEGESLGQRLLRGAIGSEEALALVRRVCEALAFAHARGVVHRDVKPSNLFLLGGNPERPKLLDFGIARPALRSQVLTRSGTLLGTIGYMAPEQAMRPNEVDARADVFALGCVLFECLTGRPPFHAEHPVAVLAKVLRAQPPRIGELLPEIDGRLDALVANMLAKDPADRPRDAGVVLDALERLADSAQAAGAPSSGPPGSITQAERRFVSVILLEPAVDVSLSDTSTPELVSRENERLSAIAERFGIEATPLTSGAWLFLLSGRGAATDRAFLAAACALALNREQPGVRIALASGSAETTGQLPVGPAIDEAASMLRKLTRAQGTGVAVDRVTASLLGARFDMREFDAGTMLLGQWSDAATPRLLLGKPTPCLGRDKELAILHAVAEECFAEPIARAALVTGDPGIGKSRLRTEFLYQATSRRRIGLLPASGDQTRTGSSLSVVRQLVRQGMGIAESDPAEAQIDRVRDYVERRMVTDSHERVAEFLCELLGVPVASPGPLLRASRDDARIMSTWLFRAFREWLGAECQRGPTLVALEDAHWADRASLGYLCRAFRDLSESPLLLVVFSRPEIHDTNPELRSALPWLEVVLGGLTRRPAEQLIALTLGPDASKEMSARIVRQAAGNAFYLEELIRAVADGRAAELPETVVAMAQARLDGLSTDARRILRAASVFGDVFSERGVAALLRGALTESEVTEWLDALVELELLAPFLDGSRTEIRSLTFRHALLREAAHATLTESDRRNGHRMAAEFLVQNGESSSLVVAEHFERGGVPLLGLPYRQHAAEAALNAGHNDLAYSIADRGLAVAEGEIRGRLLELQQTALTFRGDFAPSFEVAEEAMKLLPRGSTPWFRSAASRIVSAIYLGRPTAVLEVLKAGAGLAVPSPNGPFGLAVQMIISALLHAGARATVLPFAQGLDAAAAKEPEPDPIFTGWRHTAHATLAIFMHDRIAPALENGAVALASFDSAADFMGRSVAMLYYGIAHVEAGAVDEARALLAEVAGSKEKMLLPTVDFARYYLARLDAVAGKTAPAESLLDSPPGIADGARGFLAEACFRNGDLDRAESEALRILESASCYARATSLSVLGRIELARGRFQRALELLDGGLAEQERGSVVPFWRSTLLLARSEALLLGGQRALARQSIAAARDRIREIAASFRNEALTRSYLSIDVHRKTLEQAREWEEIAS
jgi:serine/threonine protein kinase/tetratricopeptide (TPR) repeat protein